MPSYIFYLEIIFDLGQLGDSHAHMIALVVFYNK